MTCSKLTAQVLFSDRHEFCQYITVVLACLIDVGTRIKLNDLMGKERASAYVAISHSICKIFNLFYIFRCILWCSSRLWGQNSTIIKILKTFL